MTIGVVIPCYRQERFLPRTLAALEGALAGSEWRGALVLAAPGDDPPPALTDRWRLIDAPPAGSGLEGGAAAAPLTPGAARMLGFAACGGEWVLFVDADVEVDGAWMGEAIATAVREPGLGGLWGRIEEWFVDRGRERPGSRDMYGVGDHERRSRYLATLAFYRREALAAAGGYDPRLSSEEDFELGLRFERLGLELRSLGQRAARHWSAPRPSFAELSRRWRNGLCFGQGQVLRLYLGRPGFVRLLLRQALYFATLAMWTLGAVVLLAALVRLQPSLLLAFAFIPVGVVAAMSLLKGSVRLGLFSLLTWTFNAFGMVAGFFGRGSGAAAGVAAGSAVGTRDAGAEPRESGRMRA
jgi:hypothetical protein